MTEGSSGFGGFCGFGGFILWGAADFAVKGGDGAEMKKDTHLQICCVQVIVHLAPGGFMEIQRGFRLDDDLSINDHIQPLNGQLLSLVHHPHAHFAGNIVSTGDELTLQRHYVDVLEESESESVVNLIERPDDGVRGLSVK